MQIDHICLLLPSASSLLILIGTFLFQILLILLIYVYICVCAYICVYVCVNICKYIYIFEVLCKRGNKHTIHLFFSL